MPGIVPGARNTALTKQTGGSCFQGSSVLGKKYPMKQTISQCVRGLRLGEGPGTEGTGVIAIPQRMAVTVKVQLGE